MSKTPLLDRMSNRSNLKPKKVPVQAKIREDLVAEVSNALETDHMTWTALIEKSMEQYLEERKIIKKA